MRVNQRDKLMGPTPASDVKARPVGTSMWIVSVLGAVVLILAITTAYLVGQRSIPVPTTTTGAQEMPPPPLNLPPPQAPPATAAPPQIRTPKPVDAKAGRSANEDDGGTASDSMTITDAVRGRCVLEVDGRRLMTGTCLIDLERDGSFSIYDNTQDGYFAMVFREGAEAIGHWNGAPGSTHAHDTLGILRRNGACWENQRARVCAWRS